MKRLLIFTLLALLAVTAKAQYVGLNDNEILNLKKLIKSDAEVKKSYTEYQKLADSALAEKPHPLDTIRTEGLLMGNPKKMATLAGLKDMRRMYAMAIAYRISNQNSYLQNLVTYLTAWAKVNKSKGDPIDDTNMDDGIAAYDMVKANLNPTDKALITKWFKQVADAESRPMRKKGTRQTYNNWNSHRLKIIGQIGWATEDTLYQNLAVENLKIQLACNLNPDGTSIDFKLRDALHYHVYDLEPLLRLAIILKRATGVDYYTATSATGSSIQKSVEWVVPYLTGEKTHGEFTNSKEKFDHERGKNGEAEYIAGSKYDTQKSLKALGLAAYFNPEYNSIIKTIAGTGNNYSDWQLVVNKVSQP